MLGFTLQLKTKELTSALANQTTLLILLEAHWAGFVTRQFRAFLAATGITAMLVFTVGGRQKKTPLTQQKYFK